MNKENFDKVLAEFAEEVNLAAKRELGSRKIGKNRTYGVTKNRTLQKSLTYSIEGGEVSFGSPLPYATFIHFGVNGTVKRQGSPYSFSTKQPPSEPIKDWMKAKGIQPRDKDGKFIAKIGPRGGDRMASAAWMIARAIKRNGIVGLRYYSVALESIVPQFQDKLGESLAADLLKALTFQSGAFKVTLK